MRGAEKYNRGLVEPVKNNSTLRNPPADIPAQSIVLPQLLFVSLEGGCSVVLLWRNFKTAVDLIKLNSPGSLPM